MTRARSEIISPTDTPYYHCVSRCVRRAFLCGTDHDTGECYEHRRQWLVDRIRLLSSVFAIDICSYAVMSNHYHIVIKLGDSSLWDETEVIQRWTSLYKGPLIVQRLLAKQPLSPAELTAVGDIVSVWRERLQNLSWFMKCLNEPIARMANTEDNCTGHFWESRFKSQALLTEEALLSCMAYVDLNPIRSKMASTPEDSEYTSIQERLKPQFDLQEALKNQPDHFSNFTNEIKPLLQFEGNITSEFQSGLPFSLTDYLQLVDWTGKAIHPNKRGSINPILPPILIRLNIPIDDWLINSQQFEKIIHRRFRSAS